MYAPLSRPSRSNVAMAWLTESCAIWLPVCRSPTMSTFLCPAYGSGNRKPEGGAVGGGACACGRGIAPNPATATMSPATPSRQRENMNRVSFDGTVQEATACRDDRDVLLSIL